MPQTIVSKGITQSGAVSATLTLVDVAFDLGKSAFIFVGSLGGTPDTVVWGSGTSQRDAVQLNDSVLNSTSGLTLSVWEIRYIRETLTQDIVATWASTNSERIIGAVEVEEGTVIDVDSNATQDSSTAPNTGTAVTSTDANTIQIACFLNNGRTSDALGTLGEGHTSLVSDGTVAVGVLMHITYEILTATGDVRGSNTVATARDWCNIVLAFKKRQTFTITGVTQYHRTQNQNPDWVWVGVEDESGRSFPVAIDPLDFDAFTDADVTNFVRRYCLVWAENILDSGWNTPDDSARNTRMATFVNDEIVV